MSKVRIFFQMIKFEHSIFALPFAYLGLVLASDGFPTLPIFLAVTLAMISARFIGVLLHSHQRRRHRRALTAR